MHFLTNRLERQAGIDFNGDGYIGGQGLWGHLERATHFDFNGDGIIGRMPDIYYGGYGGFGPYGGYGGGYGGSPYGYGYY